MRTEVGMGDPKHPALMCDSPGLSWSLWACVCSSHGQAGSFGLYSLKVGTWDLPGRPGGRGAPAPGARVSLCGWERRTAKRKPFLIQHPRARAQGSSASGPVPLTCPDWELDFIPWIL